MFSYGTAQFLFLQMDMKQIVQNKRLRRCAVACALLAAALLACGPFLSGGVWHGSDLGYHLRRIENIAMGLADGRFPVRVQSDWLLGNGYAVGVFYGDILLYFPAALRLLGVPVTAAYDLYLFAVTLFTAAAAYYAVRRLAWPRMSALAAAVLYTLSAYRLCDVTDRAALGEYTALAFLPLAAAGLWRTLCPDSSRLPGWLLLVLGLSGVLQSHLLSFELTVLCLALAALVLARRTFARAALVRLAGAAGAFCALNAGFLVPLLDYYFTGKFQINQPGGVEPIQQNGAALGQLLGVGYALDAGQQQDLVKGMALTPGPALLLGALCAAGLTVRGLLRRRPAGAAACLGLGAAGAFGLALSSNLFPWDALYALGGAAERLIGSLQFPWRFLGPACLLLALAAAGGLALLRPRARAALAAVLCLLAAEMMAKEGKSPSAVYAGLTERHGAPCYQRLDAPADTKVRNVLKGLTVEQVDMQELAGERVESVITHAPGNEAPIGGIKVMARSGWFAVRPSGTEPICKVYTESFAGEEHLRHLQKDAIDLLDRLLQQA